MKGQVLKDLPLHYEVIVKLNLHRLFSNFIRKYGLRSHMGQPAGLPTKLSSN
jgi:hypothetical protein